jgi:F0F1-type ATP synthase assembly protein I
MADSGDDQKLGRGYGTGYAIVGAGFGLAVSILFFAWLGYTADKHFHTAPLLLLIGLAIGLGAGFYGFWLKIRDASKPGNGTGK